MSNSIIIFLPTEVLTCSLLPLLDHVSMSRLSQTCSTMRDVVHDHLLTSKSLDMTDVDRWISDVRSEAYAGWPFNTDMEKVLLGGDREKGAFMFLTRNATVTRLRKLTIGGDPVHLPIIKKLVKQNKDIEELSLVDIKVTNCLMKIINKLPKLTYLEISPARHLLKASNFWPVVKELKEKECQVFGVIPQCGWSSTQKRTVWDLSLFEHPVIFYGDRYQYLGW
jgi:hypothetical protein